MNEACGLALPIPSCRDCLGREPMDGESLFLCNFDFQINQSFFFLKIVYLEGRARDRERSFTYWLIPHELAIARARSGRS